MAGFRGEIEDINETLKDIENIKNSCCDGCIIQLMNAEAISGKIHLKHAVIHALNAFERKNNLANNLGIEILTRASAQRQISKAFEILGLKKGNMEIAAVLISCPDYYLEELSKLFKREDDVLNPNNDKLKKIYNISNEELKIYNITDILIDKTSQLIVEQ
nr:KEOPS complex subunit Cgi121 [Methanobrevibacter curvatus]